MVNARLLFHGGFRPAAIPPRMTGAHKEVLLRIGGLWWQTARHLADASWDEVGGSFARVAARSAGNRFTNLRSELVDLPVKCGEVDPRC